MNEQSALALIKFFEKYNVFLRTMLNNEKEKLSALLSNSLPRIEHSILTAQADAKQMDSMEKKRMTLQQNVGCGGYTLEQLIDELPSDMRARMSELCDEVRSAVEEIRFHNEKSMDVARTNVRRINPDALAAQPKQSGPVNPYTKAKQDHEPDPTASILKTKA